MATTTPLFGWSVPTSSDLVKNGATAIETLGDSIDASMGDLLGGTTGQVLAKASNTSMDFTWTTASSTPTAQGVAVYNSTDQSIASGSYVTATFNSEYFDTDAFHSTSSNTGRLTVPASMAGEYAIVTNLYMSPSAGGDFIAKLQINGSDKNRWAVKLRSGEAFSAAFTSLVTLAVADYVEVLVYQNTGSAQNLSTNQYGLFGMYRIGA